MTFIRFAGELQRNPRWRRHSPKAPHAANGSECPVYYRRFAFNSIDMKIGLIQSGGIGDIVIAAPIAQHYAALGHEVFWPVSDRYFPFVKAAFPTIGFNSLEPGPWGYDSLDHAYNRPLAELQTLGCDEVICLYSNLVAEQGLSFEGTVDARLANSLKFDEYKYAVAKVPFTKKWELQITRDPERENALLESLGICRDFVLIHSHGSNFSMDIQLSEEMERDYQIVRITEVTDNPFDWLGAMEAASMLFLLDSCFANLAEQLDIGRNRTLFLRSGVRSTPVFKNCWEIF